MPHLSENVQRLSSETTCISEVSHLGQVFSQAAGVQLLRFPFGRSHADAMASDAVFQQIARQCERLPDEAVVCVLTTPPDAALLLPHLEKFLKFQLWIAVKTPPDAFSREPGHLPQRHAALLVLTRYRGALRHAKTRIGYTYCPACGKTTKDYGGKKHTYHHYGTLLSDVWRDMECDPGGSIEPVTDRLRDLFGISPYQTLSISDLRFCADLSPKQPPATIREERLPLGWTDKAIPVGSQLLRGDCLEALRGLPDNSVDFCFTDPPYNLQKTYDKWNDALESVKYFAWCDEWLSELFRVLKPGRTLAVLNIPLWAVRHYQHLSSLMDYQNWIAWDGLSFPVRMIMPSHYAIVCFSKGSPRPLPGLAGTAAAKGEDRASLSPLEESFCLRSACLSQRQRLGRSDRGELNDLWSDVHRLKHNSRRVDHPCQLPPLLMRRLFALFTTPGEMVLDCFDGAGTSTLVAHQMGRRFIGMELSEHYHQLAQARHAQIARGEDPFGKAESVPQAKNSRVKRLAKQKYEVSKKELQLDVKRIAQDLGRLPTREEVQSLSSHPIHYFDTYFISWGEVCAAARTTGMSELPPNRDHSAPQLALSLE